MTVSKASSIYKNLWTSWSHGCQNHAPQTLTIANENFYISIMQKIEVAAERSKSITFFVFIGSQFKQW